MIYNATSTLIGSSALLNGKNPSFPTLVFNYVRTHGQWRQTWQPAPGVREAVVVAPYSGTSSGFLVVGRSLKEIEIRENQTLLLSGLAGIIALVLTFIVMLFFTNRSLKPRSNWKKLSMDVKITGTRQSRCSLCLQYQRDSLRCAKSLFDMFDKLFLTNTNYLH